MQKMYYGGFWIRVLAYLIDGVVMLMASGVINMLMGIKFFTLNPDPATQSKMLFASLFSMAANFLYYTIFQAKFQGSLGKHAVGLVLVDAQTLSNMSIPQAVGRAFMMTISALVFCIGFIVVGTNKRKQGWHDKVANTLVVKKDCLRNLQQEEGIFQKKVAA